MEGLSKELANNIINSLSLGQPPQYGYQFYSVGLENYLNVLEKEYLATHIKKGGSAFKLIVGNYGGGKTHLLYNIRDIAFRNNFVVSYVVLSPNESPFHQLEAVYKAIVKSLVPPNLKIDEIFEDVGSYGIRSILEYWYNQVKKEYKNIDVPQMEFTEYVTKCKLKDISQTESISFSYAIKNAIKYRVDNDEEGFDNIAQWIQGEGVDIRNLKKLNITEKIEKRTAKKMIRSLSQVIKQLGFSGLVILLDEAEARSSLSTKQSEQVLVNLREFIDTCTDVTFKGVMVFYAVPDESFLNGKTVVYDALKQRLQTVYKEKDNPTGVRIFLEQINASDDYIIDFLKQVGIKVASIYEASRSVTLDEDLKKELVEQIAKKAYDMKFGGSSYKRLFIQSLIEGLNHLNNSGALPNVEEIMKTSY